MPKGREVPITPSVLEWAIDESGYSDDAVASAIHIPLETLQSWKEGTSRPNLTQLQKLSTKLHRQRATFLLPAPPAGAEIQVQFRDIAGRTARDLNPVERRYVRRAERMQRILGWLATELNSTPQNWPTSSFRDNPEEAAHEWRSHLSVRSEQQRAWRSPSAAFDEWRTALERVGVEVFLFPLGSQSCRGFSLWHDSSPVIAVNTAWREEARIYTLFHELGHLATRSNSACAEWAGRTTRPQDPVERWCEEFAAAVLLPKDAVLDAVSRRSAITLDTAAAVARMFRVSLRAATIRLIELGLARWDLYDEIPPTSDAKPEGGGGGSGRNRVQIKEDEFGERGTSLFVEGVKRDLLSRSQALDYLDIPDTAFDSFFDSSPQE